MDARSARYYMKALQLNIGVEDVGKPTLNFRWRNVEKTASTIALQSTIGTSE